MNRRGNNEGTISRLFRLPLGGAPPNGKRKSLYGKTRLAVARKLSNTLYAQSKGLPALDERKSLGQFLESWLATMEHQVKAGTWVRYQQHLAHLLVELKRMPIARLLPQQIEMLYAQLLSDGLSSTTVHSLHTVLHNALNDALRLGAVSRNVTALIDPPRPRRSEMQVLTPDQAKMFLAACNGERFEALYILALTTGMREGELLALLGRT